MPQVQGEINLSGLATLCLWKNITVTNFSINDVVDVIVIMACGQTYTVLVLLCSIHVMYFLDIFLSYTTRSLIERFVWISFSITNAIASQHYNII